MLWKLGIDNDVHEGCDNSGIRNVVYEGCDNSTIHNDVYECCENIGTCTTNVYVLENGQTHDRPEHCVR